MSPQFLPVDVGLGDPGLEGRLGVVHAQSFANWRRSLPDEVVYPYGWTHMLREAGLHSVAARSFLYEFASPLEAYQKDYLEASLSRDLNDSTSKQLLTTQDASTLEQLLNRISPHYVFERDDLYGIVVDTIYAGSV